jgi:phosphopantothenoylcysteine synthetase/decarboxylase
MKILVTGGGTYTPIDHVRRIDNIFHGQTSIEISKFLLDYNENVTLLIKKSSINYII